MCETLRRILGKAILRVVGLYMRQEVGMRQLCAGQRSDCETAIHAMTRYLEENGSTEGVLLVDANAFNSLNREVMLRNIQELCPAFSTCVTNFYRSSASLFVGGETIQSLEGTTEGDPLAKTSYALATLPLINRVMLSAGNATQCWFSDDAGAGGKATRPVQLVVCSVREGSSVRLFREPSKNLACGEGLPFCLCHCTVSKQWHPNNNRRTAAPLCASWQCGLLHVISAVQVVFACAGSSHLI